MSLINEYSIMKKKIGTIIDEDLLWEAKKLALDQKRPLSQLLEDALRAYIEQSKQKNKGGSIVLQTKGMFKLPRDVVEAILEEEGPFEI